MSAHNLEQVILKAIELTNKIVPTREHSLVLTKLQEALLWLRESPAMRSPGYTIGGQEVMSSVRFREIECHVWERDRPLTFEESKMLVELATECKRARQVEANLMGEKDDEVR